MYDAVEQVWAKVRRAREHRDEWQRTLNEWTEQNPYSLGGKLDAHGGFEVFIYEDVPPPMRLALLFADEVSNLRAALDMAICLIVGAKCDTRTAFPCLDKPDYWNTVTEASRRLHDFPSEYLPIIESFQPFQYAEQAHNHPMWRLDDLNNRNKHRVLVPITISTLEIHARYRLSRGLRPTDLIMRDRLEGIQEFKNGMRVAKTRVISKEKDLRIVAVESPVDGAIAWGPNPGGDTEGQPLPNLGVFVGTVINALTPALKAST